MWEGYKKGFKAYLQLEKSLSDNSVQAYLQDIEKLTQYILLGEKSKSPGEIDLNYLENFVKWISELGMTPSSQSRIISGLRSFYKYCLQEQIVNKDPTALLETPKLKKTLPDILSFDEIESIIAQINVSTPEGARNKAIIETLYSCGLLLLRWLKN
jgi:integrase/recombinase XerD